MKTTYLMISKQYPKEPYVINVIMHRGPIPHSHDCQKCRHCNTLLNHGRCIYFCVYCNSESVVNNYCEYCKKTKVVTKVAIKK